MNFGPTKGITDIMANSSFSNSSQIHRFNLFDIDGFSAWPPKCVYHVLMPAPHNGIVVATASTLHIRFALPRKLPNTLSF